MAKLQSVNSVAGKETLYVDVDDEITAIIDKVSDAKGKVVALVLPKRCPVLQSVVNMKLLKRTADNAGKNLVLVTTEAGLMPLAGATGLYVASTPTSKPSVPDVPIGLGDDRTEELEEPLKVVDGNEPEDDEDFNSKESASKSIGELAAAGAAGKITEDDIDDSINMDGEELDDAPAAPVAAGKAAKPKKDKKLKVPNFDSFRKRLILGAVALILLIVAWIVLFQVLPKATITIGTDSSTINTNLTLTLDTTASKLDAANSVVPAVSVNQQKTATQTVPATGQQNNGQKASGTVTMSAGSCSGTVPNDIPAGTTLSASNVTFVLNDTVSFFPTIPKGSKQCVFVGQGNQGESNIPISALTGGSNGNVSSASFTVTGNSGVSTTGTTSGGTDSIITIVQQSDIENATNKLGSADTTTLKQQLESALEAKGLQPVPATLLAGSPQTTMSAQAGAQASNVTVTQVTTYTMLGVKKADLQTLVDNNVNGQLDKGRQVILDDGVQNAQFAEANPGTDANATVAMTVQSQAGPQLNVAALKTQLAGKKSADVQSYIKQTPGVTDVTVKYSPFWVDSVPHKASKVHINIIKAGS